MSVANKDIIQFFRRKMVVFHKEAKIRETISKATEAYYLAEAENTLSGMEFLYYQSKYIRKYWWGLQGILLLGTWFLLQYSESSYDTQRIVGIAAPLFVILIMPEIWKNKSRNAMEIEGTTYYSLRQIYSARFFLFAMVDLILLSLFFLAASLTGKFMVGELVVQFLVPFNGTCCVCFRMLYSRRVMSETFAISACIIWAAIWVQIVLNDAVYSFISASAWMAMLVFSALYLLYVLRKGQRRSGEIWEVTTSWN